MKKRNNNIALGYFQNPQTAQRVLRNLRKNGLRRSGSVYYTPDGVIHIDQYSQVPLISGLTIALILAFAIYAFIIPKTLLFIIGLLILLVATMIAWGLFSTYFFGIDHDLMARYAKCVIRDETLVIVQVKDKDVRRTLKILRQVVSGHPTSFLIRDESLEHRKLKEEDCKEPLTTEQLQEHAATLATSLKKINLERGKGNPLVKRLRQSETVLAEIRNNVAEAEHVEQTVTLSAEWLLDNTHVVQGNIEEVYRNLPKKYYQQLPKVVEGPMAGLPRIYVIANEIICSTANKLNRENIEEFLKSYQNIDPLTIGELWALPLMLRLCLIEGMKSLGLHLDRRIREGELASYWGNRLLYVARREPERLTSFLNYITEEEPFPSAHFAQELLDHLFDEDTVMTLVKDWVEERLHANIHDIFQKEQKQETAEEVAFSNAIISLITLSQLSWREVFESQSAVDSVLNMDPAGIYSKMDFTTRDSYRHSIEILSRRSHFSEIATARLIVEMAEKGEGDVAKHVGYYLIDAGRPLLESSIVCSPTLSQRFRRWMNFHPKWVYLGSIGLFTALIEAFLFYLSMKLEAGTGLTIFFVTLALIPVSELSVQFLNLLLSQLLPPFILPKLCFEKGVPDDCRTLVIMPTMLTSQKTIQENVNNLEIHYLANQDPALRFGLFADFTDAAEAQAQNDEALLDTALKGIKSLEDKYGAGKFFLFHRQRTWSASESAWIGWERKRGKLEWLNRFLINEELPENILRFGQREALNGIRYVITLDADTQLPKDKARHMIETIAHPLNTPRISSDNKIVRGYTIIQPRVSTDFTQSKQTFFLRIFADVAGVDPYTQAISDIYQDLMREGTYHGKGIYDIRSFNRVLSGQIPEEHLLSHDLIEGAYVRTGFASDISLFDMFPEDYLSWSKRQHRWMRGDWQIADWLLPYVYNAEKKKVPNPLSLIHRWKIFDNLRRALEQPALLALLLAAWFFSASPGLWTGLAAVVLLMPAVAMLFCNFMMYTRSNTLSWSDFGNGILRAAITIALLPQQAYLSLDALFRVIYRRLISHRHLLEWHPANLHAPSRAHKFFLYKLGIVSIAAILVVFGVFFLNPVAFASALPFCLLWAACPLIVYILNDKTLGLEAAQKKLSEADRILLRRTARKTWRYFDDFVGPKSNWLPPDNYQAALAVEVAQRTSPTNMGLWLLAVMSAYDLKYITCDDAIDRVLATFQTFKKLELYEGHFLNWYDIQTLRPLYPRYVSTVDSGNFLASIWTLEQAVLQMLNAPLLHPAIMEGICDTIDILLKEKKDPIIENLLLPLKRIISIDPVNLLDIIACVDSALAAAQEILAKEKPINEKQLYWLKKLEAQIAGWDDCIKRYFAWADILGHRPQIELESVDPNAPAWRTQALQWSPSLHALASGEFPPALNHFIEAFKQNTNLSADTKGWLGQLNEAVQKAQWLAGEKASLAHEIIHEIRLISDRTNMRFLYNADRKLFSIGYHVDDFKLDTSYYDLLASEARISSLVAIAKGEVPLEHWWALGRPYSKVYGIQVLVSWGGTMFEYLMPLLFTRHYSDSLLGNACKAAVECQIIYGQKRGIPWGISESAFSEIDANRTYQYRSFGVPGLGFKRDLEEDLVVSPYSTALALSVKPLAAVKNLMRLSTGHHNLYSAYGYYESIDFARQQGPHGERGVIVYAYMAHHQGMSLLAINNVLNNNIMHERFHSDPRICGVESLLYERIPLNPPVARGTRKEVPLSRLTPFSVFPVMGIMDTPHTPTPKVNLLSNGTYSIMITNAGGGYSKWRDFDITRWRSDTTCDYWGSYCYIKDIDSGMIWSSTFHPTNVKGQKFSASFKADRVEFRRRDNLIETLSEIVVSPEDNSEIRLMTIANLSKETRHLELTSYSELALAPHNADRAHPCFNKFFIQTEALPSISALLAFRRLRSPEDKPVWAAHIVASNQNPQEPLQFETDRTLFIGRGNHLFNPAALNDDLKNSEGYVLDPIFSLRKRITLEPGQRVQVSFITSVTDNRDSVIELAKKYGDIASSHRALEMAWTHAQLELRHLRIHQEEAQLYQKLASRVLYPHSQLRPSTDRLRRNCLCQPRLWTYGISGDLPIVTVVVADIHELDLVKQALTAHAFWRLRGLKTDLVILNEEATGYEHPLYENIKRIIHSQAYGSELGKPGGIFLLNCDQVPKEDVTLILSVSCANLIAARGFLRQQLVTPMEAATYPSRLVIKNQVKEEPSKPLPFLELPYFNGLGGFTPDGKEYAIYLGPGTQTPAPWINVIANQQFGTLVSEAGLGCTWYGNSQMNRLTPWSNDPLRNPISDTIYIRDDETGIFWTPTPSPVRELDAYRIRHGQGYTLFEHNSHNIEQELLVFVPVDDNGGIPVRIQRLRLRNDSLRRRQISAYAYTEWVLGTNKEETQMHVITDWDPESQSLFAYNKYNTDFGDHLSFACTSPQASSYTGNRTEFIGRNHYSGSPAALKRKSLSGKTGAAEDPCAALQVQFEMGPGEQKEILFILGYAPDAETARKLILQCSEAKWADEAFKNTKAWWDTILGTLQIDIPDMFINFAINRWLLYQNLSCRIWGRSAFYQSSGAYGFRDQLQDVMGLLHTRPNIAREQILRAASRQFVEGDVQHWWQPPSNGGVRTRISDDLLWLPYVTAQYVRVTKDASILNEEVPFIKGDLLKDDQHEAYFVPQVSTESGTLLEHCRRAILKGITSGPHGLPLIGSGDWNDGLNLVGIHGKGESVWLAWFLIHVMNDFAELLSLVGQPDAGEGFRTQAKRLAESAEDNAWDGNWYRRAYFDDGTPLGSKENSEDMIDSLPQTWGIICGAANSERTTIALKAVEEYLIKVQEKIVLLSTPPFDKTPLNPGYIKGYPPGVRENGGQYTHGSLWVPLAFAMKGEGDKAIQLLRMMHPVLHTQTVEDAAKFKVEPYVSVGDIYALPGKIGHGGWSWYTGSAGWMYRIWVEDILGFKLRGDVLKLEPALSTTWNQARLKYKYQNSQYDITYENPERLSRGKLQIELDGKPLPNNEIPLVNDGLNHIVRAVLKPG